MRTGIAYTCARILLLAAATLLLHVAGARGFLLLALAFGVSALASYVLLSKQRDAMSSALSRRLSGAGKKAAEFRARLEEGTAAEDADDGPAADLAQASGKHSEAREGGPEASGKHSSTSGPAPASRHG
jgi:hypothetical protein